LLPNQGERNRWDQIAREQRILIAYVFNVDGAMVQVSSISGLRQFDESISNLWTSHGGGLDTIENEKWDGHDEAFLVFRRR
jgi:hypothetical protein